MDVISNNKKIQYAFVCFVALVSTGFWSFQALPDTVNNLLRIALMAIFIMIVVWSSYVFNKPGLSFKTNVILFITVPFLSVIGAYIYHHQSFLLSISQLRENFLWLFYFVLHIFQIEKKKII